MPPKNKSASKKPAKSRTPTLIDGLTKEEMSKEQLEEHIVRLREELDREREERNYFQLKRDKIHTFWEATERQLEEVKAELKNIDKEIEEDERHCQVEIKVYKQKMKHLLCEHQNTISELKADDLVSTEVLQKQQEQLETEIHKEMRAIMVDMKSLDNENLVKELKLKHDEEMTKARNSWEKKLAETSAKYERMMEQLLQDLDMEKNETIERKRIYPTLIANLKEDHNKVLNEAAALIMHMQQDMDRGCSSEAQIDEMKEAEEGGEEEKSNDLAIVLRENKCLASLLMKAESEKELKPYARIESTYEKVKTKEINDLKRDYEALKQKFCKLQLERDELYKTVPQNIQRAQQKADEQNVRLESMLKALTDSLEKTQAQLDSVLSDPNLDQTALREVTKKVEEKLDSYNKSIKNLQYKKAQISKASKDLELTYAMERLRVNPFQSRLALKKFP